MPVSFFYIGDVCCLTYGQRCYRWTDYKAAKAFNDNDFLAAVDCGAVH